MRNVVKPRGRYSSKRDFGCLLIVGGSEVYSGAPALAGMAALRTGVGLLMIAAPRSVAATIRGYSPNLIVHSLNSNVVSSERIDQLSRLLASSDALVLGPGIGRHPETVQAIPLIIEEARKERKPILIDADAIRALAEAREILKDVLITPHAGEFKAISGVEAPQLWRDRLPICKKFAKEHSCVLLLKGHDTLVTDGSRAKVNHAGNPGMATAGAGDVLSGIIGAFLAQGVEPFSAAVAGAYIHGVAGDMVCREKGFHMVASDLIEALPAVLRRYDRSSK
jgi:NAD(P)H-hydrate epimerase